VLELETIPGVRVVGGPAALDGAVMGVGVLALRFAPDELFSLSAEPRKVFDTNEVVDTNPELIVVTESGFRGCWLAPDELAARVLPHIDWALPDARPALAQGLVAGVPAKLWLESGRALLLCAAPYAHELVERLG
jgi:hypothetical protein